jgi:hypothetical protein
MSQPGYIANEFDVAEKIARDGKWGDPPKYYTCETCGFHVIPRWHMGEFLDTCPVDHADLINGLRTEALVDARWRHQFYGMWHDMADEILRLHGYAK